MVPNVLEPENPLTEAKDALKVILEDQNVPKNIKIKLQEIIETLESKTGSDIKANKALTELDEIANNPNLDTEIRTQIWNILSLLERSSNGQ